MVSIERTALVQFSDEEMYQLVCNVEAYPEFLPWCHSAKVLSHQGDVQEAELTLKKGPWQQTFATKNILTENTGIEMALSTGDLKRLSGTWSFAAISESACEVRLCVQLAPPKSTLLPLEFFFKQMTNDWVNAFCKRAEAVYGR